MKILFTICARAGSKGIKNKNLRDFLGYPLAFYTVSAIDLYVKRNPNIHCDIVLNTDSQDLIQMFRKRLNLDVDVIEREAKLALDNTPKVPVIRNCWEVMKERKAINYDMVVDLDITAPLRTVVDIENLINKGANSDAEVIFSVTDARRNPYFNMVKKTENGYERIIKTSFNARQEAPEILDMNASMYAFSPKFLERGRGMFEVKCDITKMMDTAVLDLDHEIDFELMQVIADYLFKNKQGFGDVRDNIYWICSDRQTSSEGGAKAFTKNSFQDQ